MMFKTHIAIGFLIGLLALGYLNPANKILFVALVLFGAALPDIDHPDSFIGRKTKVMAWLFQHRGFWHGLFALVPLSILFSAVFEKINLYAILIGYVSHLAADATTKEGIMFFHPFSRFRIDGLIHTGKFFEHVLLGLFVVFDVYMLRGFL